MEKFNVPDKLYYPIHEVAEKLGKVRISRSFLPKLTR